MKIKATPASTPEEMTEAELLSAAHGIDLEAGIVTASEGTRISAREATNEILNRQYDWLTRMCMVEFREPNAALDCLQDIMIEIAKSLPHFDGRSALRTWIYVIAKRTIYRHRKKTAVQRERFPLGREDDISSGDSSAILRSDKNTEQQLLNAESHRQLLQMVSGLPEKQRHAVLFHYFEDMSVEDTAARMGCSPGTVKVHLFRARAHLRKLLEQ